MQGPSGSTLLLVLLSAPLPGCGPSELGSPQVTESRFVTLADFGDDVSDCRLAGPIRVPGHEVGLLDRLTGGHVEHFFNELAGQAGRLDANLVLPTGDHPAWHAARSGLDFVGEAYACPEPAPPPEETDAVGGP